MTLLEFSGGFESVLDDDAAFSTIEVDVPVLRQLRPDTAIEPFQLEPVVGDEVDGDEVDGDGPDVEVLTSFARCSDGNGTLTHLFFSDDEFDVARAKAICSKCGLAPQCLSGALEREEAFGVWGGQLLVDGLVVAVKRGRGRPPKHPRPVLVVDEVPVPPHLVA